MPTYKNNTDSRIVDQGISFDPGQTKSTDKILAEEIITVINIAGTGGNFVLGDLVTGTLVPPAGAPTGTVFRFDYDTNDDNILGLIDRNAEPFGPIRNMDANPQVPGQVVSVDLGTGDEVTSNLVGIKVRLTKTSELPYYIPVTRTEVTGDVADDPGSVGVDVDKIKAIVIDCTVDSIKVSLNVVGNVIKDEILAGDNKFIIPTNGNINCVLLTYLVDGAKATVYQCESLEQAYYI